MRRADRALSDDVALEILRRGEYGVLSTVSADGQPYGVPVGYACVEDALVFHCAIDGHKLDNLAANPRVSFCVVGPTEVLPDQLATRYESAIAFGSALELTGEDKRRALVELVKKYAPRHMEEGERHIAADFDKTRVFRIEIESLSGKARR